MKASVLRHVRIAIAFGLLLAFHGIVNSQNRIYGQVLSANNRPVPEVYVELINDVNRIVFRSRTDGSGGFVFSGMGTGRYIVRVLPGATDYLEETQEVQITNLSLSSTGSSDSQQVVFFMRKRRNPSDPAGSPGVVFVQEISSDAKKNYEKAIADLDANRVNVGITELQNAVNIFPDYFLALDRLGVELLKQQKYLEAKSYFERATKVNEKSSNSWYGLAFSNYALNQVDASITAAKKATEIAPDSPEINLLFGIALRKGKQYQDAEKSLLKAKKLTDGKLADACWNLALLYVYNLKNNRLAADELENYLKVKPDHPNSEVLRKLIRQLRAGV